MVILLIPHHVPLFVKEEAFFVAFSLKASIIYFSATGKRPISNCITTNRTVDLILRFVTKKLMTEF